MDVPSACSVSPMSLGATRHLLAERLGLRLTHHLLRRVYDTTLGNPLFTLEVGRLLVGRDLHTLGEDVPVPDDVEDLLGMRVADLSGSVRRTLLSLALDSDLSAAEVDDLIGAGAVQAATREGVVAAVAIGFVPHIHCLPRRRRGSPRRSSGRTSIARSPRSSPTSGAAPCTSPWPRRPRTRA